MDEHEGINLAALRRQIADNNFALRPHAMQHTLKEGFTEEQIIHVALNGLLVETYPDRCRCLLYADVRIEGLKMPLHVLCEHRHPESPVDIVTAYVPFEEEWETPARRRKKRK